MEQVTQALKESGYRVTEPRLAVARVVAEADDWLAPEQVHRRALAHHGRLGLVTVYRTLDLLAELGVVRRIHLEDGCHGYARSQLAHGHHLICRDCQQVVEFPGDNDLDGMMARLARRTGFVIEDHLLELLGVCPTCQEAPDQ